MSEETLENSLEQSHETVNTGGRAYIAKSVYMSSGDFVGWEQNIQGDDIIGVPIKDIEHLLPEAGDPLYQRLALF